MMKLNRLSRFLLCICLALPSISAFAQTVEETERLMNDIKMDETMLYGEDFNENKVMASNNALYELLTYVNELRTDRELPILVATDLQTAVKEISYSKNGRHFVMVYIPIEEMYALPKRKGSSTPASPVPESKPTQTPTHTSAAPTTSTIKPIGSSDDILDILCGQDNWTEIKGFLSDFKSKGKIKETGFSQRASEVPEDAYTILIDEMYGILAILSPKNSKNRINYRTNQPDSETNYSNCKVIVWYR